VCVLIRDRSLVDPRLTAWNAGRRRVRGRAEDVPDEAHTGIIARFEIPTE